MSDQNTNCNLSLCPSVLSVCTCLSLSGHDSQSSDPPKAKSSAKALYGSDEIYFLRSSAKHKKKSQKQRKHFTKTSINSLTDTSQYHVEVRPELCFT
ncbi:hypothetical protein GBF38_001200 [Nibea albiflora]|uniref:Uncharacterized protein n=1 Tax=Nibea albiflora TaxID=240163 RepID=A0ACB7EUS8_NIBAL|nr:hypothetical protein GBF38_001200 [Nibea albiflora]